MLACNSTMPFVLEVARTHLQSALCSIAIDLYQDFIKLKTRNSFAVLDTLIIFFILFSLQTVMWEEIRSVAVCRLKDSINCPIFCPKKTVFGINIMKFSVGQIDKFLIVHKP